MIFEGFQAVNCTAWSERTAHPRRARHRRHSGGGLGRLRQSGRESAVSKSCPYNPFISHAFLSALEASGSATARTGWQPQHLVAETDDGAVLGAVPCYLKSHSRGEYVFDAGWAEAYERAGGSYYPKLQVAVPFTPATGRRLLVAPGRRRRRGPRGAGERPDRACQACARLRRCTSPSRRKTNGDLLGERGFLQRTDQQFHWENAGYATFDDFLGALASRKRKAIRRERATRSSTASRSHWLTGRDLTEERLGRVLRVLHGHRLAQMGPALSHALSSIR